MKEVGNVEEENHNKQVEGDEDGMQQNQKIRCRRTQGNVFHQPWMISKTEKVTLKNCYNDQQSLLLYQKREKCSSHVHIYICIYQCLNTLLHFPYTFPIYFTFFACKECICRTISILFSLTFQHIFHLFFGFSTWLRWGFITLVDSSCFTQFIFMASRAHQKSMAVVSYNSLSLAFFFKHVRMLSPSKELNHIR